jgi:transcriptional regulator with XRE-family HTH domain
MRTVLERYEDDLMGLPYPVTLLDIAEQVTGPDGSVIGVGVPNAEGIAATVAMALCFLPQRLIGAEVRFVRRVLGKSSQELAAIVDLDPSTQSRWENDKQEVAARTEKALRMAAVLLLLDRTPGVSIYPQEVVTLKLLDRKPGTAPMITVQAHKHAAKADRADFDATAMLEPA